MAAKSRPSRVAGTELVRNEGALMLRGLLKSVMQFMVLVSSRPWGRYPLEIPLFLRNDSRFNVFILKTLLELSLSWMASSNFALHVSRLSSVSAYSVYESPRCPS